MKFTCRTYRGGISCLNICSPDLLKRILVKDFPYFSNHPPIGKNHKFAKVLAFLGDQEWKAVREVFTNAFTASKLKHVRKFHV
jgi:hypothetical protein